MKTYFFSHRVGAKDDPRIKALKVTYGKAAYADFFMLLEDVLQTGNPTLELSNSTMLEAIADEHEMTSDELVAFISDAASLGLFDAERWGSFVLTSDGIAEEYIRRKELQDKKRKAGIKSGKARATAARKSSE